MTNDLLYTLIPLILFNVFMLGTVVWYAVIDKTIPVDQEVKDRHASRFLNRWFRSYWVWLISPIERFFIRCRISPNALTMIGFLISGVFACLAYAAGHLGVAGWMVIMGGTFDMFDGRVARATGQVTRSGAYFDAVMDRYGEGVAYFGLLYFYRNHPMFWVVLIASLGAFMVSYAKGRAEAMGVVIKGGSMQRPERIVYLGVASVFSPLVRHMTVGFGPWFNEEWLLMCSLVFMAIATNGSAISRMREASRALDRDSSLSRPPREPLV